MQKKKAYFPNPNGKSFNLSLESNRIMDKKRSTSSVVGLGLAGLTISEDGGLEALSGRLGHRKIAIYNARVLLRMGPS